MKRSSSLSNAAVIIIISGEPGDEKILLTKRSSHLREHAGEVAFPGGKMDSGDKNLYETALRECEEEVGINADALEYLSELPVHQASTGSRVTPFVARLFEPVDLTLNPAEIAAAFWVPVALFTADLRVKTHIFRSQQREYWAPVYCFDGYEIWGLTARVLVTLVNTYFGQSLRRQHHSAPELVFSSSSS